MSALRLILSGTISAACCTLFVALMMGDIRVAPVAAFIVTPHALLGTTVYWRLELRHRATFLRVIIASVIIGIVPMMMLTIASNADYASVDDVATVVHGVRTLAGWLAYSKLVLVFGLSGAVGGAAFWLAHRLVDDTQKWIPALVAVGLVVGIAAIPAIALDRSCHNPMQDGRPSLASETTLELDLDEEQWPDLVREFEDFNREQGWSIRTDMSPPSEYRQLNISSCGPAGTDVTALAVKSSVSDVFTGKVMITVAQPQGGNSWREPARNLVRRLMLRWPGHVRFKDEKGGDRVLPAWLRAEPH